MYNHKHNMIVDKNQKQLELEAIDRLLEVFDNDPIRAVIAIRDYAESVGASAFDRRPTDYTPEGKVLLRVEDLHKVYKVGRQKLEVLNGVSLQIHEGEFVAITGASGSGKSTLLQIIGGLDKPSKGEVYFDDVKLSKLSDKKLSAFRRQTVGFVFQFFYLQPFLTLERNMEVPGMFARTKRAERIKKVSGLAEAVGLTDRLKHLPKELSGGQMQRVAIARSLMNNPKIILADEPTGNLDSKNSAAIVELFDQIRREIGTTVVMVTHDQSIARRADREIVLSDGRLV